MKKIAIVFLVVILAGCSVLQPTKRTVVSLFSDYREYAKEGFLISPIPYINDYESIGELNLMITPALEKGNKVWGKTTNGGLGYEQISANELVSMAVKEAKSKGANALVNFSITLEEIKTTDIVMGGVASGYRYHIKGFCIKRK
jgi:hypothetical protein